MKTWLILLGLPLLTACSDEARCSETCFILYGAGYDQCYLQRPGRDQVELVAHCKEECTEALGTPGELGSYYPYERQTSSTRINLENNAQAEFWMECIAETNCQRLSEGYCAPVW